MFSRDDTKAVKGAAILLMLLHHLAAFADRWPKGFDGFTSDWLGIGGDGLTSLASASSVCVALFFFLAGYGMRMRQVSGRRGLAGHVFSVYRSFWKVALIFIPIAYLCFARSGEGISALAQRYVARDAKTLIGAILANLVTYNCSINSEWWFLNTYLCVMPLGYLFCLVPRRGDRTAGFLLDMLAVILLDVLIRTVIPQTAETVLFKSVSRNFYARFLFFRTDAISFFTGIAFARHGILDDLKARLERVPLRTPVCLAACAALFTMRMLTLRNTADAILIPLFVAALSVVLGRVRPVKKAFMFLGRHSANIWLTHTFYCYYFLECTRLVYCTQNVWVDLAVLLGLSLATSVVIERFWALPGMLRKRFQSPKPDLAA